MRDAVRTAGLIVLSLLLSVPALAADRFTVGDWNGQARYDKGTFSRCTIEGEYRSGITIDFGLTRDFEVEIWLQHPDWNLAKGRSYEVEYWIDGYAHAYGELISFGGGFGRIEIANAGRTFEQLRQGMRLFVADIGKTEIFRLDNTYVALDRLRQCVEMELRAERGYSSDRPQYGRRQDPGYRSDDDDDRGGKGDVNVSAAEFMGLMFRSPAMAKFRLLKGSETPSSLRGEEVVWLAPNAVGFANRIIGKTAAEALQERIENDRDACGEGKFASTGRGFALPNGATAQRYVTICRSTETLFAHYATYPARDGSVYLIAHLGIDSDAGAEAADQAVFAVISDALRK